MTTFLPAFGIGLAAAASALLLGLVAVFLWLVVLYVKGRAEIE